MYGYSTFHEEKKIIASQYLASAIFLSDQIWNRLVIDGK